MRAAVDAHDQGSKARSSRLSASRGNAVPGSAAARPHLRAWRSRTLSLRRAALLPGGGVRSAESPITGTRARRRELGAGGGVVANLASVFVSMRLRRG